MQALGNITVCLLQQLSYQQHHRSGAVTADVILRSRRSSDHNGSWILNLHLTEEDVAVLGEFDLTEVSSLSVDAGVRGHRTCPAPSTSLELVSRWITPQRTMGSHLDRAQRAQVRLEHILQAFARTDVDFESFTPPLRTQQR